MSITRWITLTVLASTTIYLMVPSDAPPPPRAAPMSVLGPAPALEPARPLASAAPIARADAVMAFVPELNTPGPFAPRPRPPAVVAFGAAAPLAAGQDVSGYWWGGIKPDLSD